MHQTRREKTNPMTAEALCEYGGGVDLRLTDVTVAIGETQLLRALSLDVSCGQVVGLIGPNGSGKSTALRCIYRALKPSEGTIWLGSNELTALSQRHSAQSVAAVTQDAGADFDFTVAEIVALGRAPHLPGNQALSDREKQLCAQAMSQLRIAHLADRGVLTLSGGERQRVVVARALVQEPRVLVLDEPTNHLDLHHQIELLSLLRASRAAVVVVLHDLNLAASVCDRIGVLSGGALVASGPPEQVLTAELIHDVFAVEVAIVSHPLTAAPQLLYTLTPSNKWKEDEHESA